MTTTTDQGTEANRPTTMRSKQTPQEEIKDTDTYNIDSMLKQILAELWWAGKITYIEFITASTHMIEPILV